MRLLLVALLTLVPAASAQPAPPERPLGPHWRIGLEGGLMSEAISSVAAVSVDRSWHGPIALGGRAWAIAGGGVVDDGPDVSGGGGEAYAVAGTGDRWMELRARAGLGLAALDYSPGGLGCDLTFEMCVSEPNDFDGMRLYLLPGLGLDVYPLAQVGLGARIQTALLKGPVDLSSAEVGLRVRLGG